MANKSTEKTVAIALGLIVFGIFYVLDIKTFYYFPIEREFSLDGKLYDSVKMAWYGRSLLALLVFAVTLALGKKLAKKIANIFHESHIFYFCLNILSIGTFLSAAIYIMVHELGHVSAW